MGFKMIKPEEEVIPDSLSFSPLTIMEMIDMGYKKAKEVVIFIIAKTAEA